MFRYVTIAALCTTLSVSAAAGPEIDNHVKVALLPVNQDHTSKGLRLSNEKLAAAVHVEFTKAASFELVEFSQLHEQFQDQLVEDAMFELLVTDDLAHMLHRLEAFDTEASRHKSYIETARRLRIDYLAEVTIEELRDKTEINYKLTDTASSRVVLARSFTHASNDGGDITRETAQRLTRGLWKLKHSIN